MSEIAQNARELVGCRFRHQGRDPAVGLDCVGVVVLSVERAGYRVQDEAGYGRIPRGDQLEAALRRNFTETKHANAGDILLLTVPRSRTARHLAVYVGGDQMVHADGASERVECRGVSWRHVERTFRAEVRSG